MNTAAIADLRSRREELGQFLTAPPVADLMASMFGPLPRTVRLLDAGAGDGALTAAFVSRCCRQRNGVRAIDATLYELDGEILDALGTTMQECARRCAAAGIHFTFTIQAADFIRCQDIVGIHYDTFPPIRIDHEAARAKFRAAGRRLHLLGIGETQAFGRGPAG